MNETLVTGNDIKLTRTYDAPPEALWRAFTDPELIKRWYAPVDGWEVSRAEIDLRVDGGYAIAFGPPGGAQIEESATYTEVVPSARLAYRMHLQAGGGSEDTEVLIEITAEGSGCTVVVTERGYSDEQTARKHAGGWTRMLDQLRAALN